jgi:imidazolonepropionase-like amidohydrolase
MLEDLVERLRALRARVAVDGVSFRPDVRRFSSKGAASSGWSPSDATCPADCSLTEIAGTVLTGVIGCHVHLVADGAMGSLEQAGAMPEGELDAVVARTSVQEAAAGVTKVLGLGDSRFCTLRSRNRLREGLSRVVSSGPPLTVPVVTVTSSAG